MHITNRNDLIPGQLYRAYVKLEDLDGNEQIHDCGTIIIENGEVKEQGEYVVSPFFADYWEEA